MEKLQSKVCFEIIEAIRSLFGMATGTEKYIGRLLFMFTACSRVAGTTPSLLLSFLVQVLILFYLLLRCDVATKSRHGGG